MQYVSTSVYTVMLSLETRSRLETSFRGLGLGLGLECSGLGLGLGLECSRLGLGLGLEQELS